MNAHAIPDHLPQMAMPEAPQRMNATAEVSRVLANDPDGDRWEELLADYTELKRERDSLASESKARYPHGFTGNGVPGDFESLEMDYADADRDFRDWLASDDGQVFRRLRASIQGGAK